MPKPRTTANPPLTGRCIHCGKPARLHHLFCDACETEQVERERQRVMTQNYRAREAGLPADLTIEEWLETIADYNGLCAYCQQRPYEHLEHFIPIDAGGGTTVGNCVPACGKCNYSKGSSDPNSPQVELLVNEVRERVRHYLAVRAESIDDFEMDINFDDEW
ncbi:MAG: HNH endonuclease [Anaerolineaceae bacterium]|nr:HNH endonuclease [Anaerolineaceae bacterium]